MHAPHVACRKVCLVLCEGVCFWSASLLLGHMRKPFVGPRSELWQRQLEQISCERKVLQFWLAQGKQAKTASKQYQPGIGVRKECEERQLLPSCVSKHPTIACFPISAIERHCCSVFAASRSGLDCARRGWEAGWQLVFFAASHSLQRPTPAWPALLQHFIRFPRTACSTAFVVCVSLGSTFSRIILKNDCCS